MPMITIHLSLINNKFHLVILTFYFISHNYLLSEQSLQTKRSQSIHLKTPLTFQLPTNENNYHHTNPTKDSFSYNHPQSPNILRHISTPSLELCHNNHINLTRSTFGRNNIRKKQPRTNPNYVNIQIKTNDGTLRSTYIRLDNTQKCQTLTFTSSSSSSTPNSSSEQDSILCHSQTDRYFPSNETLSIDKNHTLTNKNNHIKKQFVTCTDGKNLDYYQEKEKNMFFCFLRISFSLNNRST